MSNLLRSVVITGALVAPLASQAAAPTLSDVFKASGITESGYADVGFTYNNRQFDAIPFSYGGGTNGAFALNQVGLSLSMLPSSGFGGMVDILGGQDAVLVPTDVPGNDIIFKQAYIQYATGNLTVIGGRFATLAGMEVIASTGNTNATRSLLFGIQPLTHTGVRGSFKIGDKFTVSGGLNNSYFGLTPASTGLNSDNNMQKTIELQVAATPIDGLSLALTGYKGNESTAPAPSASPTLIDFVGSFGITKAISVGLNVDHLTVDDGLGTKKDGLAAYGNLQATDKVRFGARAEYLKTKDDLGTVDKQKEVTLTAALAAASNFDVIADLRMDKDDAAPFGPNAEDSMLSLTLKGILKF